MPLSQSPGHRSASFTLALSPLLQTVLLAWVLYLGGCGQPGPPIDLREVTARLDQLDKRQEQAEKRTAQLQSRLDEVAGLLAKLGGGVGPDVGLSKRVTALEDAQKKQDERLATIAQQITGLTQEVGKLGPRLVAITTSVEGVLKSTQKQEDRTVKLIADLATVDKMARDAKIQLGVIAANTAK